MQARKPRSSKDQIAIDPEGEKADPQQQKAEQPDEGAVPQARAHGAGHQKLSHALATLGLHTYVEPFAQLGWDDSINR